MNIKQILKEWNKFLVEDKNKKSIKPKAPSKTVNLTPPTPLPNANAWDGKSAYSYNDAKGLHFFTPGIGWQTIQNRPSTSTPAQKDIKSIDLPKDPVKLYDIDLRTAKIYDYVFKIFKQKDDIREKCGGWSMTNLQLSLINKDKARECEKLFDAQDAEEEKALKLLDKIDQDEENRFEHYHQYRDLYQKKLQSTPDFSSMG